MHFNMFNMKRKQLDKLQSVQVFLVSLQNPAGEFSLRLDSLLQELFSDWQDNNICQLPAGRRSELELNIVK